MADGRVSVAELLNRITELMDHIAALEAENGQLRAKVAELQSRLGENSRNSSRPPSSDGREARAKRKEGKERSKRQRGGQPGHKGSQRVLLPAERVTRFVDHRPDCCASCEKRLGGDDPEPRREQIVEFPEPKPDVTEHRIHSLRCESCGHITTAARPDDLKHGAFGPRLIALATLLTGTYQLSKRNAKDFLSDVLGVDLALGSIAKAERRVAKALRDPVKEVHTAILAAKYANIDESSWTEDKQGAWIWSLSTTELAFYRIVRGRDATVAQEILRGFKGITGSDRLGSYGWIAAKWRQVCWAHLDRTFEGFIDGGEDRASFGRRMKSLTKKLWRWWGQLCAGEIRRRVFRRRMEKLRREVHRALVDGAASGIKKVTGMCKNLIAIEDALWTFVHQKDVQPTNNEAERTLRIAVIWRKTSFGTDSWWGSRYVERILTATTTLRKQRRRVFQYLVALLTAARSGASAPSLLPVNTS